MWTEAVCEHRLRHSQVDAKANDIVEEEGVPSPLGDNPFLRRDSEPALPSETGSAGRVRPLIKKDSAGSLSDNRFSR